MNIGIKIIFFSLFTLLFLQSAYAQILKSPITNISAQKIAENKITLVLEQTPLREAITEVARLSGVEFVFSDDLLDGNVTVSLELTDRSVPEVLDQILKELDIGYVVQSRNQIVLTRKSTIKRTFGTIQGKIVNRTTEDALWNANLEILGSSFGTATDRGGFFSLKIPVGRYDIRVSNIGFEQVTRQEVRVAADRTTYLTFRLQPTVVQLPAVSVSGTRSTVPEHMQIEPSVLTIRRSQLTSIPFLAEPDLFRALQTMPGVSSPNDISTELYIRGGDPDQNLVLLDGAVVYNPFHLFGLASAFNSDIIEQANVSLGGFSARYGDRLSSVIDIQTLTGSTTETRGFANFSFVSSKFTADGRFSSRVKWLVSGRRTYHDVVASAIGRNVPYFFYDLYGKLIFQSGKRDLFYVSSFFSRDTFSQKDSYRKPNIEDTQDIFFETPGEAADIPAGEGFTFNSKESFIWDNLNVTGHWLHEFSENSTLELQASQSRSPLDVLAQTLWTAASNASQATRQFVEERNTQEARLSNTFSDVSILDRSSRLDWTYSPHAGHRFSAGGGYRYLRLNYSWETLFNELDQEELVVFFDEAPNDFSYKRNLQQWFFYAEDSWNLSPQLQIRPGLRVEKRDYNDQWTLAPRFNLSYDLNPSLNLKAAYGQFYQGISTSLENAVLTFLPVIFPTEGASPIEKADHFIAGVSFKGRNWQFSTDLYYKKLSGLLRAVNGIPEFEHGSGKAYGLELGIRKLGDRLNLEMNYALSYTKRKFGGNEYFGRNDQRHSLTTMGKYHLGRNWEFNFRWVLASGRPFTAKTILTPETIFDPVTGQFIITDFVNSPTVDFSNTRNQVRYPVYHRLDLGLIKRIQKHGWAILPYVQLLNAYFRKNVLYFDWQGNNTIQRFERKTISMLPIIPTLGVSLEF